LLPFEPSWSKAVYHFYVIRSQDRQELERFLSDRAISTGLPYPIPPHLQSAYGKSCQKKGNYLIAEKVAGEILSPRMFPDLTRDRIEVVVSKIKEFVST